MQEWCGKLSWRSPNIEGRTVLAAIALPPSLLTRSTLSYNRQVHLIHHADDRLCVWTPSHQDMKLLQQQRFIITHITGWRAYLGTAQHNYAHWTRVTLPEGRHDLTNMERIPGVLPFEVYAHAPLRLISWCSFELNQVARRLLRDLAVLCEEPTTTTKDLVDKIALRNTHVHKMSETLRNTLPRWPQCTSHPEPKCPHIRPWSNTSSVPCNCPWPSIC